MIHYVNKVTGTIILVSEDNEAEIKKYDKDKNYYRYFMLLGDLNE